MKERKKKKNSETYLKQIFNTTNLTKVTLIHLNNSSKFSSLKLRSTLLHSPIQLKKQNNFKYFSTSPGRYHYHYHHRRHSRRLPKALTCTSKLIWINNKNLQLVH